MTNRLKYAIIVLVKLNTKGSYQMGLTYRKTDKLEKMLEDFIVVPEKDAKTEGAKEPKTDEKLSFNVNVSAKENK